jgi:excisionase family DNA binding protein
MTGSLFRRNMAVHSLAQWRIDKTGQSAFIAPMEMVTAKPDGNIRALADVAACLKAGKRAVYWLAASGEIPAFKLGGTWRFRRSELDQWIAASINENETKPKGRK